MSMSPPSGDHAQQPRKPVQQVEQMLRSDHLLQAKNVHVVRGQRAKVGQAKLPGLASVLPATHRRHRYVLVPNHRSRVSEINAVA